MPDATTAPYDGDPELDALAQEYLHRRQRGESVTPEGCAAQVADPARRAKLRELAAAAELMISLMPLTALEGRVLGGRYLLLDKIGEGGMGQVWRANDQSLGRDVAVKILDDARATPQRVRQQQREARALAALAHPGIVAVHDSGQDAGVWFFAMELVSGRSMAEAIEALRLAVQLEVHPAPGRGLRGAALLDGLDIRADAGVTTLLEDDWFRTAAKITVTLLRALEAAHGAGVLHRDLKPSNVMLTAGGHPVLIDFGLAGNNLQPPGSLTSTFRGTMPYLAPEQVRARQLLAEVSVDVYQAGLVLYELLTLERAFPERANTAAMLHAIEHGLLQRPHSRCRAVPRWLEDVCLRALERAPEQRYASAAAFRQDLERWLAGAVPDAAALGRVGSWQRDLRYTARRHRGLLLASASLLAGAALAIALLPAPAPADIRAVAIGRDQAAHPLPDPPKLADGEQYGVEVEARVGLVVYALYLFGRTPDGAATEIQPVRVQAVPTPRDPTPTMGLALAPGRALVALGCPDGQLGDVRVRVFVETDPLWQQQLEACFTEVAYSRSGQRVKFSEFADQMRALDITGRGATAGPPSDYILAPEPSRTAHGARVDLNLHRP